MIQWQGTSSQQRKIRSRFHSRMMLKFIQSLKQNSLNKQATPSKKSILAPINLLTHQNGNKMKPSRKSIKAIWLIARITPQPIWMQLWKQTRICSQTMSISSYTRRKAQRSRISLIGTSDHTREKIRISHHIILVIGLKMA